MSDLLVELCAKQVVPSGKGCLVLTSQGVVHSIDTSKEDYVTTVSDRGGGMKKNEGRW